MGIVMDLAGLVELLFVGLGAVDMNLTLWGMVWGVYCAGFVWAGVVGLSMLGICGVYVWNTGCRFVCCLRPLA